MNKINILENYIGQDTCNFINESIKPYLVETPNKFTLGGPSGWIGKYENKNFCDLPNKILPYKEDTNYNISIDLITSILSNMCKTVSEYYQEQYILRSFFYGVMLPGASNKLHMDNFYLNSDVNQILPRNGSLFDKSGILYLNDQYDGGNLYFPIQDLLLKPKPGTMIFFEGNNEVPHEVQEVINGERKNIITFFVRKDIVSEIENWETPDSGNDGPESPFTIDIIHNVNKNLL